MIEAACSLARASRNPSARGASSALTEGQYANAPLVGLEGSDLAARFRHWRGTSGQRYLFSVFPLGVGLTTEGCPRYGQAVVLAVSRAADGTRTIVWAGQTGLLPDLVFDGGVMRAALMMGANEIHMHLLAKDQASRDAMIGDLVA